MTFYDTLTRMLCPVLSLNTSVGTDLAFSRAHKKDQTSITVAAVFKCSDGSLFLYVNRVKPVLRYYTGHKIAMAGRLPVGSLICAAIA